MVKAKKKICFVLGNYWGQCMGGAELQVHYLEEEILRHNRETHYCFISNGNEYKNNLNTTLHPIFQKKICNKLNNIKYPYAKKFLKILKEIRPDVIYLRSNSSLSGIASYYVQKNNCLYVLHVAHDRDTHKSTLPLLKPYLIPEIKLAARGIKEADLIITQSHFQTKKILDNYGRKAVLIPNAHPVPVDCNKSTDEVTVLWIANWKKIKQPEMFVSLVEESGEMKNVRFIMVGRTARYSELVRKAKRNNIEVVGELPNDEVNCLLKKSHILVNTSQAEGFSNTFIQAWMRRVPVVSLHVDPDKILEQKKMGYCSGRFDRLVQDTKRLIADHEMRNVMGSRARNYAIKHYSLDNMKQLVDVIQQEYEKSHE